MKEAFDIIQNFFLGKAYTVFAVGCMLAVLYAEFSHPTFFAAFIFALLLLILSWASAMAGRGL
jgi:hypothetical protein